jgi:two-component system, NtrC family, sensor kinase
MENARLITETREALEQQTATAEVLQVINSSPGDLAPVFDAMLEKAMHLCEAETAHLLRYESGAFSRTASCGVSEDFDRLLPLNVPVPNIITGDSVPYRALASRAAVNLADLRQDASYRAGAPAETAAVEKHGVRSILFVPLLKESEVVGCFVMHRLEVRPFSEKHIALLQSFAAQAVIAMENARLLGELQQRTADLEESLEYQTATSDVLQVISRSTFDLQPVLNTVAETAARLCEAQMAFIFRRDGEVYRLAVSVGFGPEVVAVVEAAPIVPGRGTITGRAALTGRVVHIPDTTRDPEYTWTDFLKAAKSPRTVLSVPLLRQDEVVGVITVGRDRIVPFTERQIELVRTFADQAVIAIENTRLLTELRESLEQQQAIAEILQVINRSPGDLQPVFDVLLDKAMALCGAAFGALAVPEGNAARNVAVRGAAAFAEYRRRNLSPATPGSVVARWLSGEPIVHITDVKDDELYRKGDPARRALVDLGGARSVLYVGLQKDGKVLGAISVFRQEVRPFSEKEIALLQSFAAQAVIAMDNARLLDEIRQRQAELRVTFDNMGDAVAMFDADLKLAAWNMNFRQMLDLPEGFLAERPSYADYIRHLAERGEFGTDDLEAELSRRLEHADEELRLERTRPDGRVIEVRRNSVAGGGMVLIYSDITERKRAEEEIRAARDAAEAALAELRTAQASLIHAEKMASLGQLTAGIAHEIKNPLNFVNNFAGLSVELLDELKQAAAPALSNLDENVQAEIDETVEMLTGNLETIAEHGKRADGIVKSMLAHSRGTSGERQAVDINSIVEEALNLAYHGARAQDQNFNITLERDFDTAAVPIELVPQDVTRVFLNLIGNGFYAANKRRQQGDNSAFKPILKVATRDLGDAIEVRVRDNGIGISAEHREKLFQPFFTTKPTGEGTGLGLSISYDIVTQQHGGAIAVDSEPGQFTEFTITLPRTPAAASGRPEPGR